MAEVIAQISEHYSNSDELAYTNQRKRDQGLYEEYRRQVPDELPDDLGVLIGQGLFFEHDWSLEGTVSYIWVERRRR